MALIWWCFAMQDCHTLSKDILNLNWFFKVKAILRTYKWQNHCIERSIGHVQGQAPTNHSCTQHYFNIHDYGVPLPSWPYLDLRRQVGRHFPKGGFLQGNGTEGKAVGSWWRKDYCCWGVAHVHLPPKAWLDRVLSLHYLVPTYLYVCSVARSVWSTNLAN